MLDPDPQWYKASFRKAKFPNKGVKIIVCYWCLNAFNSALPACPDCNQPTDIKRSLERLQKLNKGYLDYVRADAIKAGKDVRQAVRRARSVQRYGAFSEQNSRDLIRKCNAYINKGMKVRLMPWRKSLTERKCELCPTVYTPKAGNQKYCPVCQKVMLSKRSREQWQNTKMEMKKARAA